MCTEEEVLCVHRRVCAVCTDEEVLCVGNRRCDGAGVIVTS